jgi:uncharacterized protein
MSRGGRIDDLARRVRRDRSPIHGDGCFARVPFAGGECIGTFEGTVTAEDGPHVLWVYDPESRTASARRGTNLLRWLNHSPDPNAEFSGFRLYARRPIGAGEEITIDYGAGA